MHRQQMKLKIFLFVHYVHGLNLQPLAPPSHISLKMILQNQKQWNYQIYNIIYLKCISHNFFYLINEKYSLQIVELSKHIFV